MCGSHVVLWFSLAECLVLWFCVSLLCDRHRPSSFHPRWCPSRWSDCVSPSHQSINPVLSRGYKRRKSPSGRNLLFGQNSFSGKIPSRPEPLVGQNPLSGPRASRLPGQNSFSGKIPFREKFLFGQNSFSPRAPRRAKPLVGAPTVEKIIPLSQCPTFGQEPLAVVVGAHAGSHKRAAKRETLRRATPLDWAKPLASPSGTHPGPNPDGLGNTP